MQPAFLAGTHRRLPSFLTVLVHWALVYQPGTFHPSGYKDFWTSYLVCNKAYSFVLLHVITAVPRLLLFNFDQIVNER